MGKWIVLAVLGLSIGSANADGWENYQQTVFVGPKKIEINAKYRVGNFLWDRERDSYSESVRDAGGTITIVESIRVGGEWVARSTRTIAVTSADQLAAGMLSLSGEVVRSPYASEQGIEVRLTENPSRFWVRLAADTASLDFTAFISRCGQYLDQPRHVADPWRRRRNQRF